MKFKETIKPIHLTEDFWYMLTNGGWLAPEKILEESDASRVREAIKIIQEYKQAGLDQNIFIEI